jgi:tyrosyl-tRNA synthetase
MAKTPHSTDINQIKRVLSRGVETILPDLDSLATLMAQRPIRMYLGIDPTGNQLTLGHGVALRKLQQFAELGHQVILLVGNGTVKIGDPTGRDTTRPLLSDADIDRNFQTWKQQASKILNFDIIEIRYNGDWLDKLTYVDLIKILAQTTVQQLLERDMFQERLKKELPIFGHEILYPLMQGYDSVVMDVDLEIGGSDQLFNMMTGRLLQKQYNNREKWVLTTPIIAGTDGRKMSKSYDNYISLVENPVDMYGKIMRISDEQIIPYLTILTELPDDEIAEITRAIAEGENPITAKKLLAHTITSQLHSAEDASQAAEAFQQAVQEKTAPSDTPIIHLSNQNLPLLDILVLCQPRSSRSALRRLVDQRAVSNAESGEIFENPLQSITVNQRLTLKVGKRQYYHIET